MRTLTGMTELNTGLRRRREILERANPVKPPAGLSNAPKEKPRTKRVEVDEAEYRLLRRIAGLAMSFYPVIEQTNVPVTRPREFEEFRRALENYLTVRSVSTTETEAMVGLADMARDLASS